MTQFKQSPVVFDEEAHSYSLEGKRLLGITGLIHSVLGLGVYPDASDYTKEYLIPRAGSRGTAVHHAIQTLDQLGIRQETQVVNARYGSRENDNIRYQSDTWDVSYELTAYINHLNTFNCEAMANELTVSDNVKWASQIDNVWRSKDTGGLWLVDTKTNNIDLFPKCGYFKPYYFSSGEEGLKEYLSWQLSIYAYLFEKENPGMKVEGLACNWLRKDRADFWIIERKSDDLVEELLSTEYIFNENGPIYWHHDPSVFGIGKDLPAKVKEQTPIVPQDVLDYFSTLLKTYKETEAKLAEAKTALRAAMEQHNLASADFGTFSATIAKDSEKTVFDSKKFKSDHPDLYKHYTSRRTQKGGFTVKLKETC